MLLDLQACGQGPNKKGLGSSAPQQNKGEHGTTRGAHAAGTPTSSALRTARATWGCAKHFCRPTKCRAFNSDTKKERSKLYKKSRLKLQHMLRKSQAASSGQRRLCLRHAHSSCGSVPVADQRPQPMDPRRLGGGRTHTMASTFGVAAGPSLVEQGLDRSGQPRPGSLHTMRPPRLRRKLRSRCGVRLSHHSCENPQPATPSIP